MVCAGGSKMRPGSPRPKARERARKTGLAAALLADDQNPLAWIDHDMLLAEPRATRGRSDGNFVENEPVVSRRNKFDVACLAAELVHLDNRQTKARDPQKRGPPIGDRVKIINEPAKRRLHLIEGSSRHHQSAE